MILPADISDRVSCMPLGLFISAISDSYNFSKETVCLNVNAAMTEFFNNAVDFIPTKYAFFVSKSEMYRIMSTVRNKILDWAILLEENGILGEGMTFTEKEKEIAVNTQVINNYTNNFFSDVSGVKVKQRSD